jgi:hypothetical protein
MPVQVPKRRPGPQRDRVALDTHPTTVTSAQTAGETDYFYNRPVDLSGAEGGQDVRLVTVDPNGRVIWT